MKTIQSLVALALALGLPLAASAQSTVFNDTFSTGNDTVQSATPASPGGTPTDSYTAYEYFQQGAAPTTPIITSGDMHVAGRTTTSSISESKALFTTTPITLVTPGDWIDLTIVFTDTVSIFPSGSASTLNIGLFNSGGVSLNQGARLDTGTLSGGSQNWLGYVGRIGGTGGGSTSMYTRAAQTANGTTSQNQDLLFNGASGTAAYNAPLGGPLGTGTQLASGLTQGSVYTLSLDIMLSAVGTLSISNALYNDTSATLISSLIDTDSSASTNYLTTTFDGLAFGWRYNSTTAANSVDISDINVTDDIQAVPEPGTLALVGMGAIFAVGCYRRQRK